MVKFITFAKLTDKGQVIGPEKGPAVLAKVEEIVRAYGGKRQLMLATTGRYDFVSVTDYPDETAAFKAHTKITELGLFHIESAVAFTMEAYIEAAAEKKVLLAV